jgi:dipeptidyl aminopeptidase/acylaminoacyl peptidase
VYEGHFPTLARDAPVLVYMQECELMQLAQFELGEDGKAGARVPVVPSSRSVWFPTLSPSKRRLAFVSMRTGSQQLWIHEFESGATFPVTRLDKVGVGFPQWSPDEASVLFVTRGNGKSTLLRADVATARAVPLSQPDERVRFASYAKDGRSIFFSSDRNGTWQVWRMAPDGSAAEVLGKSGGFDPRDFNGDGSIFYVKETSPGLFRLDLATRVEKRVSWSAGYWNMDTLLVRGAELYFLDYNREGATWMMKAPLHLEGLEPLEKQAGAVLSSTGAMTSGMDATPFAQLDIARPASEASIAPDLSKVVVITIARDETDLMTARLEPAR